MIDKLVTNIIKKNFEVKNVFKEYKHHFYSRIYWDRMVDESTVLLKYGGLMKVLKLDFFDLDYLAIEDVRDLYVTLHETLKKIDKHMIYHFESRRIKDNSFQSKQYKSSFLGAELINYSRFEKYNRVDHFKTVHYLCISSLFPEDIEKKSTDFFANKKNIDISDQNKSAVEELNKFKEIIDNIKYSFENRVVTQKGIKELENEELFGFLYSTVNPDRMDRVILGDDFSENIFLDEQLSKSSIENGEYLKINGLYCKAIVLNNLPNKLNSRVLRELEALNFEYRISNRFITLTKEETVKEVTARESYFRGKRKSLKVMVLEAVTKKEYENTTNNKMGEIADEAKYLKERIVDEGLTLFGYFTPVLIFFDEDKNVLNEKMSEIRGIIQSKGFTMESFNWNQLEAFNGAVPGDFIHNINKMGINVNNLSYIIPTSTPYLGDTTNKHLKDLPILYAKSNTNNTFNFNLHVDDIGHTLLIGSTGGGKSVLIAEIINGFLKYENSQIFMFDRGSSVRSTCYLNSGELYDIGKDDISFQPLSNVDDPNERLWCRNFIENLLVQENFEIKPEHKEAIDKALYSLKSHEEKDRTFTNFLEYLQNPSIKTTLTPYTKQGVYGKFFDGNSNTMGYNPFQVFEMGQIIHDPKLSLPVLNIIFHQIEKRLIEGFPTLIILDEAAEYLKHDVFANKIEDYMRTLRKKNASLLLATQSVSDITQITNERLKAALITSTSTRIFLPNSSAMSTYLDDYQQMGLSLSEIRTIQVGEKKRDYIIKQENKGTSKISLDLSLFEKIYVATADSVSQNEIKRIRNKYLYDIEDIEKSINEIKRTENKILQEIEDSGDLINNGILNEYGGRTKLSDQHIKDLENIIKNNKEKIVSIKERIIEIEERKRESILKINLEWIEYCYKGILEELTDTKTTYLYTQDIKFFETIINELKGEIKRFAN